LDAEYSEASGRRTSPEKNVEAAWTRAALSLRLIPL
jgi:hypothetical protein